MSNNFPYLSGFGIILLICFAVIVVRELWPAVNGSKKNAQSGEVEPIQRHLAEKEEAQQVDESLISSLYQAFAIYRPGHAFNCTWCYSEDELEYFATTPLVKIPIDRLVPMLHECADHWESTEAFKHFLPRLLEVMGPPHCVEDMYPEHLFQTLLFHGFTTWPEAERNAVLDYLRAIENKINFFDDAELKKWARCMKWACGITTTFPSPGLE